MDPDIPSSRSPQSFRSRRIVTPQGLVDGVLTIEDGRIVSVERGEDSRALDLGDLAILPGGIDPHVHLNEPGRGDWEGMVSGTRAAVAGGLTTLVDMPLNSDPVTTTLEALETKICTAEEHRRRGELHCELLFHGGLVPGNLDQIEPLIDGGVVGLKAFLCDSGIDEFPAVGEAELRPAMKILARRGIPLLAHGEIVSPLLTSESRPGEGDPNLYASWLASRPSRFEVEAIELLLRLMRETGCRVHLVHLATADALPMLRAARSEALPISIETCPHYLTFAAEEIPDGDPRFKCAPPIREAHHREALWQALREGTIDFVASDHSPAPPSMKQGSLLSAWGGISSLQISLPATWTGAHCRGFDLTDLAALVAARPARLLGLDHRKGALAPGFDADFIVFDPEAIFAVRADALHHRHPQTAYEGLRLRGRVMQTYCGGRLVGGSESTEKWLAWIRLSEEKHREDLSACCGAGRWIDVMLRQRPWKAPQEFYAAAENAGDALSREDWLEAFTHHPRIGDVEALRERFGARSGSWSEGEQAGMAQVGESVLERLAEGNRLYEERFGFLFIVCASGKSASEMLALLEARLGNDPSQEWRVAAGEQRKITQLRLRKMLSSDS